jgi:hypothetical protein
MDGTPVWAASATHDIAIEIAKRGHLIGHRIDPAVDAERDFVGDALTSTSPVSRQEFLLSPDPVLQALTASGESYDSDGRILLLDLHPVSPDKILSRLKPQVQHTPEVPPAMATNRAGPR